MTTETTNNMAPDTTSVPVEEKKRGRGPNRPALKLADLMDDLSGSRVAGSVLNDLKLGRTSKDLRAIVRDERAALKKHATDTEQRLSYNEEVASFLARAEELPEPMRRLLVAALSEPEAKPE